MPTGTHKYHQQFDQGLYVNDIYLTLMYKGDVSRTNKKGLLNRLLATSNQLMDKTIINARDLARSKGHLGQHLANHRLFFGDAIQFQGNELTDTRFAAMLSIKSYYRESNYNTLDPLLALDCEFIRTQTFTPMALEDGLKSIKTAYSKKINAEDEAASQIEELGTLADLVAGGAVSIGIHHHSLMLLSSSKENLETAVNRATQAYSKAYRPG